MSKINRMYFVLLLDTRSKVTLTIASTQYWVLKIAVAFATPATAIYVNLGESEK